MITVPVACVVDASVAVKLVVTEAHSSVAHDLFAHLGADLSARFHVAELFYAKTIEIVTSELTLMETLVGPPFRTRLPSMTQRR